MNIVWWSLHLILVVWLLNVCNVSVGQPGYLEWMKLFIIMSRKSSIRGAGATCIVDLQVVTFFKCRK